MLLYGNNYVEVINLNKDDIKKLRRVSIERAIGTRKYLSYRIDLILYKIIICFYLFLIIYISTSELFISFFITLQAFLIFTLINMLNLERKEKEGKITLLNKTKKEYFIKKLEMMDIANFERLIRQYFLKRDSIKYKKIGKHMYSAEKSDETFFVKIIKISSMDKVETIDIRNLISTMKKNKIKKGFIVTTGSISEDADKLIDKLKCYMEITVIDSDEIYEFVHLGKLLPEDDFFYDKIKADAESDINNRIKIIKNNTVNHKKVFIYMFAAVLFYMLSVTMPYNNLSIYVSYYFLVLTVISIVYFIVLKVSKTKVSE